MSRTFNNVYRPVVGWVKRSTEKAILFVVEDREALTDDEATVENWIPKSQIQSITPLRDSKDNSCVMMSEWIIGQKNLNNFIQKQPASSTAIIPTSHPAVPTKPPVRPHSEVMDDDIPF